MEEKVHLKLFVAGKTPRSQEAVRGMESALDAYLLDRESLEIIDVVDNPHEAEKEHVLVTPTLIRVSPKPVRRLIGDFSDGQKVLNLLELSGVAS